MPTLDEVYDDRNRLVLLAVLLARQAGWDAGLIVDHAVPDWPVLALVTPYGQLSWHVPRTLLAGLPELPPTMEWDGHTDQQKAERIMAFAREWWSWDAVAGDEDDGTP